MNTPQICSSHNNAVRARPVLVPVLSIVMRTIPPVPPSVGAVTIVVVIVVDRARVHSPRTSDGHADWHRDRSRYWRSDGHSMHTYWPRYWTSQSMIDAPLVGHQRSSSPVLREQWRGSPCAGNGDVAAPMVPEHLIAPPRALDHLHCLRVREAAETCRTGVWGSDQELADRTVRAVEKVLKGAARLAVGEPRVTTVSVILSTDAHFRKSLVVKAIVDTN